MDGAIEWTLQRDWFDWSAVTSDGSIVLAGGSGSPSLGDLSLTLAPGEHWVGMMSADGVATLMTSYPSDGRYAERGTSNDELFAVEHFDASGERIDVQFPDIFVSTPSLGSNYPEYRAVSWAAADHIAALADGSVAVFGQWEVEDDERTMFVAVFEVGGGIRWARTLSSASLDDVEICGIAVGPDDRIAVALVGVADGLEVGDDGDDRQVVVAADDRARGFIATFHPDGTVAGAVSAAGLGTTGLPEDRDFGQCLAATADGFGYAVGHDRKTVVPHAGPDGGGLEVPGQASLTVYSPTLEVRGVIPLGAGGTGETSVIRGFAEHAGGWAIGGHLFAPDGEPASLVWAPSP